MTRSPHEILADDAYAPRRGQTLYYPDFYSVVSPECVAASGSGGIASVCSQPSFTPMWSLADGGQWGSLSSASYPSYLPSDFQSTPGARSPDAVSSYSFRHEDQASRMHIDTPFISKQLHLTISLSLVSCHDQSEAYVDAHWAFASAVDLLNPLSLAATTATTTSTSTQFCSPHIGQWIPSARPDSPSTTTASTPSSTANTVFAVITRTKGKDFRNYGTQNPDGTWRCTYPSCKSQMAFRRACDLRKHHNRHQKHLFCRYKGCAQGVQGGFSSKKDRERHETKHNPKVPCEQPDCRRMFSRIDNMKDHVRRIHLRRSKLPGA
ncbi:hypothetical protein BDV59DRAFT_211238 [Aspergillus ambiguus]|uniref:uncharacterized protein n=1 Tax=Aspergillus ambiguus TaxID=176160 RepID=UPI003CCE2122